MEIRDTELIVNRLHAQLVEILIRIDNDIKANYWANTPSFVGVKYLIRKIIPKINQVQLPELIQLIDTTQDVKDYFELISKDKWIATCFLFMNIANISYFDVQQYMFKKFQSIGLKSKSGIGFGFHYFMANCSSSGYTPHTYARLDAHIETNGEISIRYLKGFRNKDEEFPDITSTVDRKIMVKAFEKHPDFKLATEKRIKIEDDFKQFAIECSIEQKALLKEFEITLNILKSEQKHKENNHPASYIKLPFNDQRNEELIDFIYQELNGQYFTTTKENFQKIFTPDITFAKI